MPLGCRDTGECRGKRNVHTWGFTSLNPYELTSDIWIWNCAATQKTQQLRCRTSCPNFTLLSNGTFLVRLLPHCAVLQPQQLFLSEPGHVRAYVSVLSNKNKKSFGLVFVFIDKTAVKHVEYFSERLCWREPLSVRGLGSKKQTLLPSSILLCLLYVYMSIVLTKHGTEWLFYDSWNKAARGRYQNNRYNPPDWCHWGAGV